MNERQAAMLRRLGGMGGMAGEDDLDDLRVTQVDVAALFSRGFIAPVPDEELIAMTESGWRWVIRHLMGES